MPVSDETLMNTFEMLVERLTNVEIKIDMVVDALRFNQEKLRGELSPALFDCDGLKNITLHDGIDDEIRPAGDCSSYYVETDIDYGVLCDLIYLIIMTGKFDEYFPDTNDVKSKAWEEVRKVDAAIPCRAVGIDRDEYLEEFCANFMLADWLSTYTNQNEEARVWQSIKIMTSLTDNGGVTFLLTKKANAIPLLNCHTAICQICKMIYMTCGSFALEERPTRLCIAPVTQQAIDLLYRHYRCEELPSDVTKRILAHSLWNAV